MTEEVQQAQDAKEKIESETIKIDMKLQMLNEIITKKDDKITDLQSQLEEQNKRTEGMLQERDRLK